MSIFILNGKKIMKNKIMVALLLLVITTSVKSQTLTVGPKVGLNISNLTNLDDLKPKVGLTAGAFMMFSFIEHFGVGLDALYSKEGAQYVYEIKDGDDLFRYQYRADLNYLRFNVPVTYFFRNKEDAIRPKIYAGPSLAFLLSAKNKSELLSSTNNSNTILTEGSTTVTDQYKSSDFGAIVGAGFNARITDGVWLNFDAAYHIGATDIPKEPEPGADPIKNQGFTFTVGVGFGF